MEAWRSAGLDIGSPSGIDPIRKAWENGGSGYLAEYLLVLCRVNAIDHPDIPKWRETIAEREERRKERGDLFDRIASAPIPAPLPASIGHASSWKKKGISDAERKKRSAHHKMNARKRKK